MIGTRRLPGSSSLSGLGLPDIQAQWNTLKANLANFSQVGQQIINQKNKLENVKKILVARNDKNQNIMDADIAKTDADLATYWTIKGYIDDYTPQWMQLDDPNVVAVAPSSGVSLVPLILGAAAIGALAYCVSEGMRLYQEYQFKSQLTQDIIEKKITAGQAAEVLTSTSQPGIFEKTIENVGAGLGFGIPTALIVAGGAYLAYQTGLLNILVGMFKGGGGTSTPSSGV
jgi:hypothetical protein